MTSQGAGSPFERGEEIMAYRACGLAGNAFIGPDAEGNEVVRSLKEGDEVIF